MATSMAHVFGMLGELRYQECEKRVRVTLGEMLVADTGHPVLIWEPKRVVPSYAIPIDDIRAELQPMAGATDATAQPFAVEGLGAGLLDPRTSFGHHTCPGDVYSVAGTPGVGFRPAELVDLMVLDFDTFDWREEDEPIFGHPRDPFSRIDLRQSTRHVRVESGGRVLAESSRPLMLFETYLPPRYYLPRADLQIDLVQSETSTVCAYKGSATHWSHPELGADLCWSYPHPPPEMHQITDLVCFYQEKTDFVVDGVRLDRPTTPFA